MFGVPHLLQDMSWKLSFMQGKRNLPFKAPWWVDSADFGAAYIQGRLHAVGKLPDRAAPDGK
jgi:hypothetical protein